MQHPEMHGGNGFAAATVGDMGFEPALGATSADAKPVRRRKVRIEVGEGLSAAGMSAAGVSTAGVSAGEVSAGGVTAGTAKRMRRKKGERVSGGALRSLRDLNQNQTDRQRSRSRQKVSLIGLSDRGRLVVAEPSAML